MLTALCGGRGVKCDESGIHGGGAYVRYVSVVRFYVCLCFFVVCVLS